MTNHSDWLSDSDGLHDQPKTHAIESNRDHVIRSYHDLEKLDGQYFEGDFVVWCGRQVIACIPVQSRLETTLYFILDSFKGQLKDLLVNAERERDELISPLKTLLRSAGYVVYTSDANGLLVINQDNGNSRHCWSSLELDNYCRELGLKR